MKKKSMGTGKYKSFFYLLSIVLIQQKLWSFQSVTHTVKPVLSGHSKIDKTKILMTNGSLMKVKILEHSAIFLTCIKR